MTSAQELKSQIVAHTKNKTNEEIAKGLRALYRAMLKNKTKNQLVQILLSEFDDQLTKSDRGDMIDQLAEVQFELMFGGK